MVKRLVFMVGLVAAAVASFLVVLSGPSDQVSRTVATPESTRRLDSFIDAAMSDNASNDARADSAPQQGVVNGWVARDLLQIIALQNEASAETVDGIASTLVQLQPGPVPVDNRPAWLLTIAVLVLCWLGAWMVVPRRSGDARDLPPAIIPTQAVEPTAFETALS